MENTGKLFITSDTKGKTIKMLNGTTFDSPLTFVTELIQNAQRAECTNLNVHLEGNVLTIEDDGVGLYNPQSLLTFDYSEWKSTDEGFGIGFWSILGIPDLETIKIESKNFILETTREDILENLSFNVFSSEQQLNGFKVTLTSDYFIDNDYYVSNKFKKETELMIFDTNINDVIVEKKDLKDDVNGLFIKDYDNEFFSGRLSVSEYHFYSLNLYYEKRFIDSYDRISFVDGVLELKKPNLKEPDRKAIVDDKRKELMDKKLDECIKDLYVSFIETIIYNERVKDVYSQAISSILSPKEYSKLLLIDESLFGQKEEIDLAIPKDFFQEVEEVEEFEEPVKTDSSTSLDYYGSSYSVFDSSDEQVEIIERKDSQNELLIKDFLSKTKNLVYIRSSERDYYEDAIGLAEYHNIKVFIAKNELYSNYLTENNIPHLCELEGGITNKFKYINEGLITKKEKNFIKLLNPIIEKYNLPSNLFTISEIEKETKVVLNKKRISYQKISNTKEDIAIFAVKRNREIVLDRRALRLRLFNIAADQFGIHELKAIMSNVNTIAHELAHLMYQTVDNTPKHNIAEKQLEQEIIALYCI